MLMFLNIIIKICEVQYINVRCTKHTDRLHLRYADDARVGGCSCENWQIYEVYDILNLFRLQIFPEWFTIIRTRLFVRHNIR